MDYKNIYKQATSHSANNLTIGEDVSRTANALENLQHRVESLERELDSERKSNRRSTIVAIVISVIALIETTLFELLPLLR